MGLQVTPSGQACGASVQGVDLTAPLSPGEVAAIRAAWLDHHVLAFPDQHLTDDDLERFTLSFGPFGDDPFIEPIDGRTNVVAVERLADETAPVFAAVFHSDWSFQENPPAGTCLYGITIPPVGGDTLFANQHAAYEAAPAELLARLDGKVAIHSARGAYSPKGVYGEADREHERSMRIVTDVSAEETFPHPVIVDHPESGRRGFFGCAGYICGIEGMADDEANALLMDLYAWQTRDEFVYRHQWEAGMLVMWDNRSVLHSATGGYDGHHRLLHRTTIGSGVGTSV